MINDPVKASIKTIAASSFIFGVLHTISNNVLVDKPEKLITRGCINAAKGSGLVTVGALSATSLALYCLSISFAQFPNGEMPSKTKLTVGATLAGGTAVGLFGLSRGGFLLGRGATQLVTGLRTLAK